MNFQFGKVVPFGDLWFDWFRENNKRKEKKMGCKFEWNYRIGTICGFDIIVGWESVNKKNVVLSFEYYI